MPCIPLPSVTPPTLPFPFTIPLAPTVTIPELRGFCCKLPPLPHGTFPIPIPGLAIGLNPAVVAALQAGVNAVTTYVNALPLSCPLE